MAMLREAFTSRCQLRLQLGQCRDPCTSLDETHLRCGTAWSEEISSYTFSFAWNMYLMDSWRDSSGSRIGGTTRGQPATQTEQAIDVRCSSTRTTMPLAAKWLRTALTGAEQRPLALGDQKASPQTVIRWPLGSGVKTRRSISASAAWRAW